MKLYEKLSTLRKSNNYTQSQIAKKLNVTRQTVSKWEMGISEPSLDLLSKIADIYDCSVDELIGRSEIENDTTEPPTPTSQTETTVTETQFPKNQTKTTDEDKHKTPFWTIDKEIIFVVTVGIIVSIIYLLLGYYGFDISPYSITFYIAIECPIFILSTIITACSDELIKTKNGILKLVLPLVLVVTAQILLGISMET